MRPRILCGIHVSEWSLGNELLQREGLGRGEGAYDDALRIDKRYDDMLADMPCA